LHHLKKIKSIIPCKLHHLIFPFISPSIFTSTLKALAHSFFSFSSFIFNHLGFFHIFIPCEVHHLTLPLTSPSIFTSTYPNNDEKTRNPKTNNNNLKMKKSKTIKK
jgi:hypothetical protein